MSYSYVVMHTPLSESDGETPNDFKEVLQAVTTTIVQNTIHKNEHDDPSEGDFPDGGLTAWGTVLGGFLIQFCGAGYSVAYGVYQDFYTQTYLTSATPSAIAWIGSVNTFLLFTVGLVSGRMLDRGAFYSVMIIGCLLQSLFLFLLSLAKPNGYYQIFLIQGVGTGIAIGLTNVPSFAVVSHHFQRRQPLAMGLVASGASLGSIIHPIILNNLIGGKLGFANGVRASAGLNSALLLVACLLMRTRLPPRRDAVSYTRVLQVSLKDPAYICACIWMATFEFGFFFEAFYFQLDSSLHGLSKQFSFYSLAILHSGSLIGRLTGGVISSYVGLTDTIASSSLISSGVIFSTIGLHSLSSVVCIGISYGYFSGICISMMTPLVSYLTPDISDLGVRVGIAFACSGIGSLLGSPICGALLSSSYIWWKPAVFAGSITMSGTIIFISMQFITKIRQKNVSVCSEGTSV